jgi:transposase
MAFVLQAGQQHESTGFEQLMDTGAVKRAQRGRPRRRPERVSGDNASSRQRIRRWVRRHGRRVTIPRKANERRRGPFDTQVYNLRARVEQRINRLKQVRRIATRYEKRADKDLGMVTLGAIVRYL